MSRDRRPIAVGQSVETLHNRQSTRRKGLGLGLAVAFSALLGSAALSILVLLKIQQLGGPDLLRRSSPELVILRLALTVPLPLVAAILISRLPRTRRALLVWMASIATALALQLPFLFPRHVGGGILIAIALTANLVGLALARGRRFGELCARFDDRS
jgi:hypothetical protein